MAADRKTRNFPKHTLQEALAVPEAISSESGGSPMNRLLLADALGIKPASTNFRDLLSSANRYGLIEGNPKSPEIKATELGLRSVAAEEIERQNALLQAFSTPAVFGAFLKNYDQKKLPSEKMGPKILSTQMNVPEEYDEECFRIIVENGKFLNVVREIGGAPHVMLKSDLTSPPTKPEKQEIPNESDDFGGIQNADLPSAPTSSSTPKRGAIFIGHGKKTEPLDKIKKALDKLKLNYKIAKDEPNLGRPIPQKVKETMKECTSAILIFTKDDRYFDEEGEEVWRPRDNVLHELGACSFLYEDKIIIFKEEGLSLPSNFSSIGNIAFTADNIESKTMDLLQELVGFGLVEIRPV